MRFTATAPATTSTDSADTVPATLSAAARISTRSAATTAPACTCADPFMEVMWGKKPAFHTKPQKIQDKWSRRGP